MADDAFIRDIEFRWIKRNGHRVLQYRVNRTGGFRGWSNWMDVKDETEE